MLAQLGGFGRIVAPNPVILPAPVVESRTAALGGFTNSHSITLPSGMSAGDLLLVVFTCQGTTSAYAAGWSLIYSHTGPGTTLHTAVFAKVAAGGDTLTVSTWNEAWSASASLRISGCNDVAKIEITGAESDNPPSLSPAHGVANYLAVAALGWYGVGDATAFQSGYTGTQSTGNPGGSNRTGAATAEKTLAMAASEDPGAFTCGSGNRQALTIMIRG